MKEENGFKACINCQCKLLAYLEKGHSFDDVVTLLKKKRPGIRNIKKYAMDAIKVSTGGGTCDNYVVEHDLWYITKPKLLPEDQYKEIRKVIKKRAARGKRRLAQEKLLYEMLKLPDMEDLLLYWNGDGSIPRGFEIPPEMQKRMDERKRVNDPWELAFLLPDERETMSKFEIREDGELYLKETTKNEMEANDLEDLEENVIEVDV